MSWQNLNLDDDKIKEVKRFKYLGAILINKGTVKIKYRKELMKEESSRGPLTSRSLGCITDE